MKCSFKHCNKKRDTRRQHCSTCYRYSAPNIFIKHKYNSMKQRVKGNCARPKLYLNKKLLDKNEFLTWSLSDRTFNKLYKNWAKNNYNQALQPSVNRIRPQDGYTLDNIEWVTLHANLSMGGSQKKFNKQTEVIYKLLGVNK